ncbi:unnamed protein product [Calicophoron daubneyi]|uniref:Major facilitator superfamily (MFS) profile domain-containing protein n=1 Tax=Calicophoron daubneyi TaxID=300641 RepID=A0AAV2TE57_CALDB
MNGTTGGQVVSPILASAPKNSAYEDTEERDSFTESFKADSSDSSSRAPSITGLPQLHRSSNNVHVRFPPQIQTFTLRTSNEISPDADEQVSLQTPDLLHSYACRTLGTRKFHTNILPSSRQSRSLDEEGCFCGPGRKRYLIAFLCCACLTIVIGMRSEMLGIITNLNNANPGLIVRKNRLWSHSLFETDHTGNSTPDTLPHPRSAKDGRKLNMAEDLPSVVNRHPTSLIFKPSEHRQMPWTTTIKNDIVENAVFFAYLITSPIGGYLTVNHDSSFLLGCSVAVTCGMNLFLPLVETIGNDMTAKFVMVILLRITQGLAEGCLIPAVFGVLRFWGPESERSTLVCVAVIGVSLGPLIGLPVCAEIEKKWGWGVVFYIYANLGLIWCIFWWRLIDEKPRKDESLGKRERDYLQSNIPSALLNSNRQTVIPWMSIFRSRPVFAIFFTYAADDWTFQISSVCMQTFYQQIYKVDVEQTIFLLSFPFLSRSIFVPIGGILADYLKMKTSLSQTTIRKVFAGLGFGLKGVFFIALGYAPSELYATVLLSLSLGFSGLAVAGYAVNVIDLAPNFSGLVMGFANSVSTFTGLFSTLAASIIVHNFGLELKNGWRVAISLAAFIQFAAGFSYLVFGSSEEQIWAWPENLAGPEANFLGSRQSDGIERN